MSVKFVNRRRTLRDRRKSFVHETNIRLTFLLGLSENPHNVFHLTGFKVCKVQSFYIQAFLKSVYSFLIHGTV